MKQNYDTIIVGQHCILVPYRPEHVERYHAWMQDPDLLEATGSEPLSLAEEYEMQASWRDDHSKCTFLILARDLLEEELWNDVNDTTKVELNNDFINRSLGAMVGDVNLFLSEEDEEEADDNQQSKEGSATPHQQEEDNNTANGVEESQHNIRAELDIMVAEKAARGKGVGREACCLMMLYGATHLSIRRFFCKINEDNEASLQLFKNKLEFQQCDYASCFRQYELELKEHSQSILIDRLATLLGSSYSGLQTIRVAPSSSF